jgi:HlyD family secretion protein
MSKVLRVGGLAAGLGCAALFAANGVRSSADVVVAGSVISDRAVAAVQHPTGGVVAEIRRRNGDRVKSGELLARLDDSVIRTNLIQSTTSLDALLARKARLEAERDGVAEISFPPSLAERLDDAKARDAVERERKIFASRTDAKKMEYELQDVRIRLLDEEIAGLKVQEQTRAAELGLVEQELAGVRQLRGQNLAPIQRVLALERDAVRISGERNGSIPISLAQAQSRIADTKLQLIRGERDNLRDVTNELRDVDERLADQVRRKVEFEQQLKGAEILSPRDGVVLSSAIDAAGCPVTAGRDIMLIAPPDEKPSVEARIDVRSASRLRVGQAAKLALVSNAPAAPALDARLERILPEAISDASAQHRDFVTLRFVLAPEAQATLATMPPGTAVSVSLEPSGTKQTLLDLVGAVARPLNSFEISLL